jgi:lysophospholipase L1-like esterase
MPRLLSSVSFLFLLLLNGFHARGFHTAGLLADDKAAVSQNAPASQNAATSDNAADRWEKEIASIEKRIAAGESPGMATLFVGSSSIRLWNLPQFFPEVSTANHGFGGSVIADSVQFFDRIVVPVHPTKIVLYAGDNDIAAGKSPQTVHEDFLKFAALVEQKLPDCEQLIFISIKPSTRRWAMADKIQNANALIKASCDNNQRLKFVDIWDAMLDSNGMPNPDLLLIDGLHMTDKGYQVWADALQPLLTKLQTP